MKKQVNYYFLGIFAVLLISGFLFLANLSAPESLRIFGNTNYYIIHQLYAAGIGLVLGFLAFKIPLEWIKKIIPIVFILNMLLMIAVFLPFVGVEFWGARRWVNIGGQTIQPAEFLKITAVLFLALWISKRFSKTKRKGLFPKAKESYENFIKIYLPFIIFLAIISAILLFQKDLGTLGIIVISLMAVYFVAGTPLWNTFLTFFMGIAAALLFVRIEPYRVQRFLVFLNPEIDPLGKGFQLRQSLLTLGSGGIFGKGWGMSTQKFGVLPQAMSDSIFAVLGEETGIIGCLILIILFILFFGQGLKIAKQSSDIFCRMAAVGIVAWMATQTFMNIASAAGLFPLTGIPLPFFSYGGTHLIAELIGVGLLFNISKNG